LVGSATLGDGARGVVMEVVLAPSLDWHVLQQTERNTADGNVAGSIRAVQVVEGAPDPRLFDVPKDAKEVSAAEFHREVEKADGQGAVSSPSSRHHGGSS
jgi:hypothetical protein